MIIWIKEILMQILIWVLGFIDTIFNVFRSVAGLDTVATPSGEQTISEYFLQLDGVQWAFWCVFIASIGICAVCTVVAVVKNIINAKGGEPKSHVRTLGQSLSTTVVALFMAMLLVVGIGCADQLLGAVDKSINHGEKSAMSHEIISISVTDGYVRDTNNVLGLNKRDDETGEYTFVSYLYEYATDDGGKPKKQSQTGVTTVEYGTEYIVFSNGTSDIPFYDAYKPVIENDNIKYDDDGNEVYELDKRNLTPVKATGGWNIESGYGDSATYYNKNSLPANMWDASVEDILGDDTWMIVPVPRDWKYDGMVADPDGFNFIIAYICAIVLLIALISATFGLVKRLFDIVLLFIALPGIAATIPLDDGAKFKLWRETVISKVFLAFGTVLAVNLFSIVAPSIWAISIGTTTGGFTDSVLRLVLICGGALTISGGQLLFARLLGTSAEESREMGQSARTLMGGAAAAWGAAKFGGRALFGTKNANGQRVGGLIKGGASAVGTLGGGAINAVGTAVGGQAYRNSKFGKGVTATKTALQGFGSSAGWLGGGSEQNPNLGYGISKGLGAAGNKFAGSSTGQKTGLANGIGGAIGQARHRHAAKKASYTTDASGTPQNAGIWSGISNNYSEPTPTVDNSYHAGSAGAWNNMPDFNMPPASDPAQSAAQKAARKKE